MFALACVVDTKPEQATKFSAAIIHYSKVDIQFVTITAIMMGDIFSRPAKTP